MPELPEVETTRALLQPVLLHQPLQHIWHSDSARYVGLHLLEGAHFEHIDRRGKFLLLHSQNHTTVVHLGMTGAFAFKAGKHDRVRLKAGDTEVYFSDIRRFGLWRVVPKGDYSSFGLLNQLGPEPLGPHFTLEGFAQGLSQSHSAIKAVLLKQHVVAGLGNIYCDEALFWAGIHPTTASNTLKAERIQALFEAIVRVLSRAVAAGGSTLSDQTYQQPNGQPGYFQLEHAVYARQGQPCVRCCRILSKMVCAGRGTHLCVHCQPAAQ